MSHEAAVQIERPTARPNGVPRSDEIVGWAPFRGPMVCIDRQERPRGAHILDEDQNCIFCSFPAHNFPAPQAEPDEDAQPIGGRNHVTLPADGQHVQPQGPGLIPPQGPADRKPGQPSLPSAARGSLGLAGVRRYGRGKAFQFGQRAR